MWAFTQPPKYGVNTNPTQGEHFVNDRVDRNDTLVREAGQNTNDARRSDARTVELRITLLRGERAPAAGQLTPYLVDLVPHLEATEVELDGLDFDRPSLLLIEDFGTLGLQGELDCDDGESLSLFWRNIGESHKGGSRGGRWGLGKTVFANSSRISTWFGLTKRAEDERKLLIGQIALRKHKIGDATFQPHALYCASEPGEFELPIEDPSKIEQFRNAFSITRSEEPGLSVAVPFPHESLTEKSLLKAAIQHFFFPILRGRMAISVNDYKLGADNLVDVAASLNMPELKEMANALAVAREICAVPDDGVRIVDRPERMDFPGGQLSATAFTEEHLAQLKEKYQQGELVRVQLPIVIRPKRDEPRRTYLRLFLKAAPNLVKGHDFYLRDGVSVIEHRSFGESEKAIGFLLADDEALSRFLGDAENPAHTAWNAKARGLEAKYRDPQKTVMFIRRSLRQLFEVIGKEEGVEDPNALLDVFFVQSENATPGGGGTPPGRIPPPPPPPVPPPTPPKLRLKKSSDGFVVNAGAGLTVDDLPTTVSLRAAYEIRRGNPFTKYHRSDFEFEKDPLIIHADTSKVSSIAGSGNLLSFQVDALDFEVEVTGFDSNRDLKLAAKISSEASEDD